jgi:hypothetical protein
MAKRRAQKKPASSKVARSRPAATKASAGEWRKVFLTTLASCGVVKLACHAAGIRRKTAYLHRKNHPKFAEAWDEAIEDACDVLEGIGLERAKNNSDGLLMFFLKARRPETYRERMEMRHIERQQVEIVETVVRTREEAQAVLARLAEANS